VTVYNMASVEFERFYSEFLPQFLSGCEGIDDSQKASLTANFKLEKVPTSCSWFIYIFKYFNLNWLIHGKL